MSPEARRECSQWPYTLLFHLVAMRLIAKLLLETLSILSLLIYVLLD